MGVLSKQTSGGSQLSGLAGTPSSDPLGMLAGFLDSDKDGDSTDDLLNLAKKFF
jgi:hypothetical protein